MSTQHRKYVQVFRSVPKSVARYLSQHPQYGPAVSVIVQDVFTTDIVVNVRQDHKGEARAYINGVLSGYLLANQPEQ